MNQKERNRQIDRQRDRRTRRKEKKRNKGWVLWHFNPCRIFNVNSSLYIYIKYIEFGLVGFQGLSTTVHYLMPNPLYTYISSARPPHLHMSEK